jgi:hypothetical protein
LQLHDFAQSIKPVAALGSGQAGQRRSVMQEHARMNSFVVYNHNQAELDMYETAPGQEEIAILEWKAMPEYILDENERRGVRIPFEFSVAVFVVVGHVCVEDPIEESYLKGHVQPLGIDFRIDRHRPLEVSLGVAKLRIGVDMQTKYVYWQNAELRIKVTGLKVKRYWKWHGRNVIFRF